MLGRVLTRRQAIAAGAFALSLASVRRAAAQGKADELYYLQKYDGDYLYRTNRALRKKENVTDPEFIARVAKDSFGRKTQDANAIVSFAKGQTIEEVFQQNNGAGVLNGQTAYVADKMLESGVSPLPDPAKITEESTIAKAVPEQRERTVDVVIDILLEAANMADLKEALVEILHNIPDLDRDISNIADQPKGENSQKLADAIWKFWDDFVGKKVFDAVVTALVEKHLAETFLKRLAVDMVPWFGWGWFGISFGLALYRNWGRLVASLA